MNSAHLHIIINHIPVIGTMFSLIVMLIGIIWKSDDVKKASLAIMLLTALITIAVYITGHDAEGIVKGLDGVTEEWIEEHEEFAEKTFIVMEIVGAVALAGLIFYRKPKVLPNYLVITVLILMGVVNGMSGWTANLGGRIHHQEIHEDRMPWEEPVKDETGDADENDKDESKEDEPDSKKLEEKIEKKTEKLEEKLEKKKEKE